MALAFVGLLCIQIFYMKNIVQIRYEQFSQGVRQSLVAVATHLEQDETRHFLEDDVSEVATSSLVPYIADPAARLGGIKYSFTTSRPTLPSKAKSARFPRYRTPTTRWESTTSRCRTHTATVICIRKAFSTT